MGDKENNSIVKMRVLDGGSAVKAEIQPNGSILFFDEDGNLTKDTLVQMDVFNVNKRGKEKRVTSEYAAQGSLDHIRGRIGGDFIFACDTNTKEKIEINNLECNFSIGVVTKLYQTNEKQFAADALFGICWIWRGAYDIELLSWDIAMQMLANKTQEKCIMVTDSQRDKLQAFNDHSKCFRSGRSIPNNFTLSYSSSDYKNTSYNLAMKVCHNTSRNIQNSNFKDKLCHGRYSLPQQVGVDEAWYAIIDMKKEPDSDLVYLHVVGDFSKYNVSE